MTAANKVSVGAPDESALLGELAEALRRVRRGDLKVRMPRRSGIEACSDIKSAVPSARDNRMAAGTPIATPSALSTRP